MTVVKKTIKGHITGIPFSRDKVRGNLERLLKDTPLKTVVAHP